MGKSKKAGAQALFDALKAKGYKQMGGEKLLMQAGGMVDFAEMAAEKMRYGKEYAAYGTEKMKMGGTSGRSTYSGSKKTKSKKTKKK